MLVVTGGAGFIGSAVVYALNKRGRDDIVIVDHMDHTEKWMNLRGLHYYDYLDRDVFLSQIRSGRFEHDVEGVIHLGACSSTTETDSSYLMENNYRYTKEVAEWALEEMRIRFIYASSAATYGDGSAGYSDSHDRLKKLRPLNMYGYSKHLFDLHAEKRNWLSRAAGLKYFNVYGPNEYHKGSMRSLIHKAYPDVEKKGVIKLFKSYIEDYTDGNQMRDFIYVKDAAEMTLYFLDNPDKNGIFNIGTQSPCTWNTIASSMFKALGKKGKIEYIPMPEELISKYQYYTCADMEKYKTAGGPLPAYSIEKGIEDYLLSYLVTGSYLGD